MKLSFTSESIEKGVHNTIDALIVNCTIQVSYLPYGWNTYSNNSFYMAANNTQNYLAFEIYIGGPFVIPTPINLTLVAEASYPISYSIVDNTIILNYGDGSSWEYTYNTKGFLTKAIIKEDGIKKSEFFLDTGGDKIPFGNFFLIFTVISVIALVYLKKQKIR